MDSLTQMYNGMDSMGLERNHNPSPYSYLDQADVANTPPKLLQPVLPATESTFLSFRPAQAGQHPMQLNLSKGQQH